jgi:predicted GNAT superfamily acetyltransferase
MYIFIYNVLEDKVMVKVSQGYNLINPKNSKQKRQAGYLDNKPYLFNIPGSLYKKVKLKMVEEDRNLRDVLIKALKKYLSEEM